jgi:hypothetical protein
MRNFRLSCGGIGLCAAIAMLAACGGSQPPIGAPGAMPQGRAIITHADRGGSWMLPDAASQDLLYVSDSTWVSVYSYPEGKLEGRLRHFYIAQGMCVDKKGDVFVTDLGFNKIFVYAHGSTKRLRTITGYGGPAGCSIDPGTGDLAASDLTDGNVAVYKNARGIPKVYKSASLWEAFWCGYDGQGNLFVDGQNYPSKGQGFVFLELAKDGSSLNVITLDQSMGFPGGVQWDGKHIAVGSFYPPPSGRPVIYQFAIKGRKGTKTGTTRLGRLGSVDDVKQFWIQNKTVVATNGGAGDGKHGAAIFYNYPSGGKPTEKITKGLVSTQSAAVSLAQSP